MKTFFFRLSGSMWPSTTHTHKCSSAVSIYSEVSNRALPHPTKTHTFFQIFIAFLSTDCSKASSKEMAQTSYFMATNR